MSLHSPRQKPPWGAVFSLVFAILYGASPIDLIPDFLPLIGWLDDGLVLALAVVVCLVSWRRSRVRRDRNRALNST